MATTNPGVHLTKNGPQDKFDPKRSSSVVSGLASLSYRKFYPVALYLVVGLPGLVPLALLPCQAAVVPLGGQISDLSAVVDE